MSQVLWVLGVVWIWLALVAPAHAAPRTDAGLVWRAPASCPDAAAARARIERRLGTPLARMVHGIEVEIAPAAGGGYVARIDLRGITVENEVRVLTSARCDELTDAVAVIIVRLAAEIGRPVAPPAPPEPARVRERPDVVPAWGGGLRGLWLSGIGAIPRVGTGGELAVFVRHHAVFGELAEAQWMRSAQVLQPLAPGRVDISLRVTALRIGWSPEDLPLRAWIGGEFGTMQGEGVELGAGEIGTGTWISAGAGFGVAWPVSTYARVVGSVEIVAPFERPQFMLLDGSTAYRPDAAAARCGFGLEVGWR